MRGRRAFLLARDRYTARRKRTLSRSSTRAPGSTRLATPSGRPSASARWGNANRFRPVPGSPRTRRVSDLARSRCCTARRVTGWCRVDKARRTFSSRGFDQFASPRPVRPRWLEDDPARRRLFTGDIDVGPGSPRRARSARAFAPRSSRIRRRRDLTGDQRFQAVRRCRTDTAA